MTVATSAFTRERFERMEEERLAVFRRVRDEIRRVFEEYGRERRGAANTARAK